MRSLLRYDTTKTQYCLRATASGLRSRRRSSREDLERAIDGRFTI